MPVFGVLKLLQKKKPFPSTLLRSANIITDVKLLSCIAFIATAFAWLNKIFLSVAVINDGNRLLTCFLAVQTTNGLFYCCCHISQVELSLPTAL